MKLRYPALIALCLMFVASLAFADGWVRVSDEIEIDYQRNVVKAAALVKDDGNRYDNSQNLSRKIFLSYIESLTHGKEDIRLEKEFKKRSVLYGKVQFVLERNMQPGADSRLPTTKQFLKYWTFDLNLLKELIPDLNMPTQDGL
jgi:hypothetical protein